MVRGVSKECVKSSYYQKLSEQEKDDCFFLLNILFNCAYAYCHVGPGKLNTQVLGELMFDIMPRKISADIKTFESFSNVFKNFMSWCEEKNHIKNTAGICKFVTDNAHEMVKASQNKRRWGFETPFMMNNGMSDVESLPQAINTAITVKRDKPKIGRNDSCTCGSGKKYKRCCGTEVRSFAEGSLSEQLAEAFKAGNVSTIEEANVIAKRISATHNARPRQEFLGLSSAQMAGILYKPFDSPELVTFNENWLPSHALALQIFNKLTDAIGEEGVKATGKGNLPIQLCRDILADTRTDLLRSPRIRTETEFNELHVLRIIGEMSSLIKQSKTKFIRTLSWQKLTQVNNQSGLFNCLFKAYVTQFNWAYCDAYPEIEIIQTGWMFSLYCLSLFGHQWRSCSFYADKFLHAFPMVLDGFDETPYASVKKQFNWCYNLRTLERFALFWGLIEIRKCQTDDPRDFEFEVRAPKLCEWLQFKV
jgi:SEC-C motif